MVGQVDCREFTIDEATLSRRAEFEALAEKCSEGLPDGHRIHIKRFDSFSGSPSLVISRYAIGSRKGRHTQISREAYTNDAWQHFETLAEVFGVRRTQVRDFATDPLVQRTSSGAAAVNVRQFCEGIPVEGAALKVHFGPNGEIKDIGGKPLSVPEAVRATPRLIAAEAVLIAAEHVATPRRYRRGTTDGFGQPVRMRKLNLKKFSPTTVATFPETPQRLTVFEKGPFAEPIKASLVFFPTGVALRLAWQVILARSETDQYRVLVDSDNGEILFCRRTTQTADARGNVFLRDGGSARQIVDFPPPKESYGLPLPDELRANFPADWVELGGTVGNSVAAQSAESGLPAQGSSESEVVLFDPPDPESDEQSVLNAFYYLCFMHNYFYLLGFTEEAGNFQHENFGEAGLASDRVVGRAHATPVQGTANILTPADGMSPLVNFGPAFNGRHTAIDRGIVCHEFAHGVTNRLVGGTAIPFALEAPQSAGMGEGWSDFFACIMNDATVIGDWVVDHPRGIRRFPYDEDYPETFADLGSGSYVDPEGEPLVHDIGEIWCAALMALARNIGPLLAQQAVFDALALTPVNPSFVDGRDAILAAFEDMRDGGDLTEGDYRNVVAGAWTAFARFGLGPEARSNSASLSGIVADFDTPVDLPQTEDAHIHLEAAPNLSIPDDKEEGATSVLHVSQVGRVTRIQVSIDIAHPYPQELQVRLASPAGTIVLLHDMEKTDGDGLVRTYSSDDLPVLQTVLNEEALGDWRLVVVDTAAADVGTLNSWSLDIEIDTAPQVVSGSAAPDIAIPDNDPTGISSTIGIGKSGRAKDIVVSVDISHGFPPDLRVALTAPTGQQVVLHDQGAGDGDKLVRTYRSGNDDALSPLVGAQVEGTWMLQVADLIAQDEGTLSGWSLTLTV